MKKLWKDRKLSVLSFVILLELIVTAVVLLTLFIPVKSYNIQRGEIIKLPYGHYYVTCEYQVDKNIENVNFLFVQDKNGSLKGIEQVDNYLDKNKNSFTTEFWISGFTKDITISVRQFEEKAESESALIESCTIKASKYTRVICLMVMLMIVSVTYVCAWVKSKSIVISKDSVKKIVIFSAILLISCIPMFHTNLLVGWDLEIHLVRIEGIMQGYKAGQLPVRVEPAFNGGYGYAFSTYYGGLFYNVAAIARWIGFSIQGAYRIYVVFINMATILISYYCFKIMFENDKTAMYGSILYSLSLYRLFDLYQRGAVGEYTAITFLPLIAAGLWKIYTVSPEDEGYKRLWILPVLGYTGIIQSHILSTEISGLFTIIVCLLLFKKTFRKKTFIVLFKIVLYTIILNLWFLYPFVENYILEDTVISKNLLQAQELSNDLSLLDIFSYNFGKADTWYYVLKAGMGPALGVIVLLVIYGFAGKSLEKQDKKRMLFLTIIAAISIIVSTSVFPWNKIVGLISSCNFDNNLANKIADILRSCILNIQYAFRFMIISSLLVTLIACVLHNRKDKIIRYASNVIVCIIIFQTICSGISFIVNGKYSKYLTINDNDVGFSNSVGNMEYIPLTEEGNIPFLNEFFDMQFCYTTNAEATYYNKQYTNIQAHIVAGKDNIGVIEFPLLYYRGYKIVDVNTGQQFQPFKIGGGSRLGIIVEPGYDGDIEVYYAGEKMWHVMDAISLVAYIILIMDIIMHRAGIYNKYVTERIKNKIKRKNKN